ncbi:MAG TPA: sugar phosphate isomerase/epimerase, partial [Mucilaginibacter sp.]|nr:sugar phosphate isomerase/epimerase [Mucilaginibacter sp.]
PKPAINRREALKLMGAAATVPLISRAENALPVPVQQGKFIYSLNMSTIRGQSLGFAKELETAAKAGYSHVEIWMETMQAYLQKGGTVKEVKLRLNDQGLKVANCIGFAKWVVDDETIRKQALEQLKREMELLAGIGCPRIAATGMGLTNDTTITLDTIAERYRAILELGEQHQVTPLLEVWGFQKQFSTVAEATYCIMQSGHASARILLDVFHLYRGRSPLETLSFIKPELNPILHMNDYPSTLSADVITDADRIYPGDGVAPIKRILKALQHHEGSLILSAELFNAGYYKQDALIVAKTALEKMKAIAEEI